jgi:hypothetical protein
LSDLSALFALQIAASAAEWFSIAGVPALFNLKVI